MRTVALELMLCVLVACSPPRPTAPLSARERAAYAADNALDRVQLGMTTSQALELTGPPTSYDTDLTGRSFIPGYIGGGTHRTVYRYRGRGRVFFLNPGPFMLPTVVEVQVDPDEKG